MNANGLRVRYTLRNRRLIAVLGICLICQAAFTATGCAPAIEYARSSLDTPETTGIERAGVATYLSDEFHGQLTASGVPYDKDAMVAAHPSLPFETQVIVTSLDSGQSVTVTVVDRLPEKVESIIDVSSAAASILDMLEAGEANVQIEIVQAE